MAAQKGGTEMIVYYSGTGNSRHCAKVLAAALGDEAVDVFHYIKDGIQAELITGKPWVFVSPTYAWQLPRIFVDFLRSSVFEGSKEAYFVMTCGDRIGNAGSRIAPLCSQLGLEYKGVFQVTMPENYLAMFNTPAPEEAAKTIAAAGPRLEEAAGYIRRGENFPPHKVTLMDRFRTGKVNDTFYKQVVKTESFFTSESCISCGKCAAGCILNNITYSEEGRPVWGQNCTHCMACITGCPVRAIDYGPATIERHRYRFPEEEGPAEE